MCPATDLIAVLAIDPVTTVVIRKGRDAHAFGIFIGCHDAMHSLMTIRPFGIFYGTQ